MSYACRIVWGGPFRAANAGLKAPRHRFNNAFLAVKTDACRSVRPSIADLPALTDIYNHYVVNTAITFDLRPFAPEERRPWFDEHLTTGRHRLLVAADESGAILGYATTSRWRPKAAYDTTVEASVYCRAKSVGRGCGTELYRGALRRARRRGCASDRRRRQLAEPGVDQAARAVRLPSRGRVSGRRPKVRQVLGRGVVRTPVATVTWLAAKIVQAFRPAGSQTSSSALQSRWSGLLTAARTRRSCCPTARRSCRRRRR